MVLTACGKTEDVEEKDDKKQVKMEEEKKTVEEDVSSEKEILDDKDSQSTADTPVVQEPSNQTESNENQSNKNETTGNNNTTTKPSTGSTGNTGSTNSGSTNNSGNTGSTTNNNGGTTTQPVHEHKWTEVRGIVVVQEAWVEDVFGWRTICGKCGLDMTDMNTDDKVVHSSSVCQSRYSAKYIKYDEIHHPAVTEEQVTGYKCECGAEKNK